MRIAWMYVILVCITLGMLIPDSVSAEEQQVLLPQSLLSRTSVPGLSPRLTLRNAVVFGYSSSPQASGGFGYYLSNWDYQVASPLRLQLQWAFPVVRSADQRTGIPYLNRALLTYDPTPSFHISFSYSRYPHSYWGWGRR